MITVNFSWDDGAAQDLKLMDLSLKYDMPGMFFIPAENSERKVMSKIDIKEIASNKFEIGAHTYSHTYLTKLSLKHAEEELVNGKLYLEDILGEKISHFCFPGGKYNQNLLQISKQYFLSARTADTGALVESINYIIKPTFHFYDRGKKSLFYNSLKNNYIVFRTMLKNIIKDDYFSLLQSIIIDLYKSPNNYNIIIWGHSWELERFGLWDKLENLFNFINNNAQVGKISYSDLLKTDKNDIYKKNA